MEYLIWLFVGIAVGVAIALLSQNESTADSVRIFTDEAYVERQFNEIKAKLVNKKNAVKKKIKDKLPFLAAAAIIFNAGVFTPSVSEAATIKDVIYQNVTRYNPIPEQCSWITDAIMYASSVHQVDPYLIASIMQAESRYKLEVYSPAGAVGPMQLMPDTAEALGYNPYNPLENILGGARYLRIVLDDYANAGEYGVTYAVAAYNAGIGAVNEYGGVPPYRETVNYVYEVSDAYNNLMYSTYDD